MTATLLFVDDQPDTRLSQARLLQARGYAVLTAANAEDALKLLASRSDLAAVITDIIMPGMDGVQLIRRIKASRPDLPVVAISGGSPQLPAAYGLQLAQVYAADAMLYKPFTPDELVEVLQRLGLGEALSRTHG